MRVVHADDLKDPIHVEDARIVGSLNLEGVRLEHPLILRDCYVEEEINLCQAEIPRVDFSGSHLWGLDAEQLHTKHDVDLREVVTTGTEIALTGARIGGCLLLVDARLSNVNGRAFRATGIEIAQDVYANGLRAAGEVMLHRARIKGDLSLPGARLFNPGRTALELSYAEVGILACTGLTATGAVHLSGSRLDGDMLLGEGKLANGTGDALSAIGLVVTGAAFFQDFTAHGSMILDSADIGGVLDFSEAELSGLNAVWLKVGQNAHFIDVMCSGRVNLTGAAVRANLLVLSTKAGAIHAASLTTGQDLVIQRCEITGDIGLDDVRVGGQLRLTEIRAATLSADALVADKDLTCVLRTSGDVWARGLRVAQDATIQGEYEGEVALLDTTVGGRLDLGAAKLDAADLEGVRAAALRLPRIQAPTSVNLTNAKVGTFEDLPDKWPTQLGLRGFTYDVLDHDHAPVKDRIGWLQRNPGGYTPGVYDTLAAAYKRSGRLNFVRKVNIAKQWFRRNEFGPLGKLWNWLLYLTVGYGYRPNQAILWLAGLLGIGTAVYWQADRVPTGQVVQAFNPFVYALDVLLPIIDLGQEKAWVVKGAAQWCSWGLIAAGWVLTTAVVAGLTNALKRD
ncbi:oxidoreductase [Lentzea sp. NBRC 105346]|uniref:hypothetical protein n=1 Tax=Lentzea sp. NBRC 105346 TaxID=3032205 RepID=UPI0024A18163|nr:hypothetical protein [Lentzea sp. NBRC 105346]GLZ29687.1 oxidoreductase [Lentzea sp. NBRC 105346]